MTTPTATTPNTYPLNLGLKDVTATITVLDATPTVDTRNRSGFTRWNNVRPQAARVQGTGTVNRIPVRFDIGLEWRPVFDREKDGYDHTRQELTWNGYSSVRRTDVGFHDDAPDGARSKVNAAASAAAMAFLAAHPEAVHAARLTALVAEAQRKNDEVAELRAKLETAIAARDVAQTVAAAWNANEPLPYAVHVYQPSGWGNKMDFERRYTIRAGSAHDAAMIGLERAEREVSPGEHDRRTATAEPIT